MTVKVRPFRNGGWEIDIRLVLPDGTPVRERRRAPVSSKSGATRWGEARERQLLVSGVKERRPRRKGVPTLKDFKARYMEGHVVANRHKESGKAAKESIFTHHLLPALGSKRLDKIGDEDIQKLKAALGTKSAKTVNNVLCTLSNVLRYAVKWKVIDRMPCTIDLLKVMQEEASYYDFEEYEDLVAGARKVDPRAELTVLLGGDAGLRLGEIIALKWTDLDLKRGVIVVREAEWKGHVAAPKSLRSRRVPMTRRLHEALLKHRHLRGPRVLYRDDGRTVTYKVLRAWVETAEARAGMPKTGRIHILRHSYCSHLAMRGATATAIQKLAGHSSLSTTQRYMHLSPAALHEAVRLLDAGRGEQSLGDIMETATPDSGSGRL